MTLRVAIIQLYCGGPWRWAILEGRTCLATSPVEYKRAGMAARAARQFIAAAGRIGRPAERLPSIQLSLFGAEGISDRTKGRT